MRPTLTAVILLALLALLAAAGPAEARARPTLVVSSLASHQGARIGPLERFRITGVVRNRGRSASPALISAGLRRSGKMAFALGGGAPRRVPAHARRKFRVEAVGPLLPAGSASRRYTLVTCVRARRGAPSSCSHLKRSVLVVAPRKEGGVRDGSGIVSGSGGESGNETGSGSWTGT